MSNVLAGQVFRHYKGNLYLVLAVADYTGEQIDDGGKNLPSGFNKGTPLVVYVGLYDNPKGNRPCVRPESEWEDRVKWECASQDANRAKGEYGPRYILARS